MKRMLIIMLSGITLLVALYLFGTGILAQRAVRVWLKERHIVVSDVSINYANLRSVSIANLSLGKNDNLRVRGADISYHMQGKTPVLKDAMLDNVALTITLFDDMVDLGGIETLLNLPEAKVSATAEPQRITIEGALHILHENERYVATLSNAIFSVSQAALSLKASKGDVTIMFDEKSQAIDIKFASKQMQIFQADAPLSTQLMMAMSGSWKNKMLHAQGKISDSKEALPIILNVSRDGTSQKTIMQWNSPQVNFKEGGLQPSVLSPLLAKVPPFSGGVRMEGSAIMQPKKATKITHTFIVENAELSPLLKAILKDDISVTGALSGVIPLHWSGEKAPQIVGAHLKNTGAGKLIYDPLTGEVGAFAANPQSNLLLEVLKGFDYDSLTLDADSDAEGNLKAKLRIQGANPDFYQGKAVDFNLNLDGNVLAILSSESKVQEELNKQ